MDSGLVTSERGPHRRATVAVPTMPLHVESTMGPTVTCRQCRVQIPVDDIESHECNPKDIKAATNSPRASTAPLLQAAARASSFLDSFLDTSANDHSALAQKPSEPSTAGAISTTPQSMLRDVEVVATPAPPPRQATRSVVIDDTPVPPYRYQSLHHTHSSPSQSPTNSDTFGSDVLTSPQHHLARLGRSLSVMSPPPQSVFSTPDVTSPLTLSTPARGQTNSKNSPSAPIQCRVRGVRLNKEKVAVYSIVSNVQHQFADTSSATSPSKLVVPREIIVERRYREFYAFALTVYAMFPRQELWQRLPPKTLCLPTNRNQSGGFLLRRQSGLDDFVQRALELINLGSSEQGSIGQWYLVRKFLNLPPTVTGSSQPTKDRSLIAAMHELKKHALQTTDWAPVGRLDEHDSTYEKVCDGFQMVKRVKMCSFPARAVFDMITQRVENGTNLASADLTDNVETASASTANLAPGTPSTFSDPILESIEVLHRETHQTWTERAVFKGRWTRSNLEMISSKTWKVDDSGSIVIVMIPADDQDWVGRQHTSQQQSRVDCILGGWVISPIPGEDTCSVTWLMQANFGECDARCEFTGSQGFSTAFVARSCLLSWANEIVSVLNILEVTYDPVHYRSLGPLLSGEDFQKLKLERRDITGGSVVEDPRVYVLARDLEPKMCLLIHKSTNTNALIFKTHHRRTPDKQQQLDLDLHSPLKAEWIMFEKPGNPRQDLSVIERSTTYPFSTRNVGVNVFHFTLEILRRDCVLRYDPIRGYALFTTISGKPNTLLKRIYLRYSKPTSRLSFSPKLEEIQLFGQHEMETVVASST